jgi:uncharacterized protein YbjT (DUF2867 family)
MRPSLPSRNDEDQADRMKLVIVGGTGRIGAKVVAMLEAHGHHAVPAAPTTGVDTVTGSGLRAALDGAAVVVDVSNAPSCDDAAVLEFFETSTCNVLEAEAAEGVGHHVVLSIVGADRLVDGGYFRAKLVQGRLSARAAIPHSIVRATQCFELLPAIAEQAADGDLVRVPPILIQPLAADDVADVVSRVALGPAIEGGIEVAGPELFLLDELLRFVLRARGDRRHVEPDREARYFGAPVDLRTLVAGPGAMLTDTTFQDWSARLRPTAGRPGRR